MPDQTISDFHRLARIGFVTGHPPRLLAEDHIFHQAVLATWVEPECISRWMDDLEDRAGVLLSEWAAERGPRETVLGAVA